MSNACFILRVYPRITSVARFIFGLLIMLMLTTVLTTQVRAASYYVATTGSDANTGSQSSPWKTIQKGANTAASGDTVLVTAGTYSEAVSVTRPGISFIAQGSAVTSSFRITANNTTVKGFEITNNSTSASGVYVQALNADIENNYIHDVGSDVMGNGITLFSPKGDQTLTQNAIVRNNKIYHAHESCIFVAGQNNLIEGNDCSHTIQPQVSNGDADCFRYFGSGHTFRNNYCHDIPYDGTLVVDSHTDCFQTWGDPDFGHNILFDGNTCILPFYTSEHSAKCWQSDGGYNLTITNNICNARLAGLFESNSHDIKILNNTFVGVSGTNSEGLHVSLAQNVLIENNIFAYWEWSAGAFSVTNGSTATGGYNCTYKVGGTLHYTGDVNGLNPLFVNEATNDYHLQAGSPCIDKGTNVDVLNDKDGVLRPQGVGYDIGAYEYASGSVTTPTPTATPTPTPKPTPTPTPTPTPKPGDANGDDRVDETDYTIWLSHYGQSLSGVTNGDFNNNGKVDGIDYTIWLNNYGK